MVVYTERLRNYNKRFRKRQKKAHDPLVHVRVLNKRASDGQIGLKFASVFVSEPGYEAMEELKVRKRYLKDDMGELDHVPPLRDPLHHSMIWERYQLDVEDEVDQNAKVAADLSQYKFIDVRELVYPRRGRGGRD